MKGKGIKKENFTKNLLPLEFGMAAAALVCVCVCVWASGTEGSRGKWNGLTGIGRGHGRRQREECMHCVPQ